MTDNYYHPSTTMTIRDIVKSLIYHGRHFSQSRDAAVEKKAMIALMELVIAQQDKWLDMKKDK